MKKMMVPALQYRWRNRSNGTDLKDPKPVSAEQVNEEVGLRCRTEATGRAKEELTRGLEADLRRVRRQS